MKNEKTLKGTIKSKPYHRGHFQDGVIFYNEKGENIAIAFDIAQRCCENYNYDIPKELLQDKILTAEGITITIEHETKDKGGDTYGSVDFRVSTQEKTKRNRKSYLIYCNNTHNGYYCHEVAIGENGEYTWNYFI